MAYQRFLNDRDYLAIITQDQFDMLIREIHDRVPQAEQSAEMSIREYLDQYYEVEKELLKGKKIRDYSPLVNYPAGTHFVKDNQIYRTIAPINGYKKPQSKQYWKLCENIMMINDIDKIPPFFQLQTYKVGDIVIHNREYWECILPCGWDFQNIVVPGVTIWEEVPTVEWEKMVDYPLWQVVEHKGKFYLLMEKPEDFDNTISPAINDCWGQIGEYDENEAYNYEFDYSEESHDYIVYYNKVWTASFNPNCDKVEVNVNVVPDEPRNLNLIKHMTRIAIYYLHQTISPTNISETRRLMYEDSMAWLISASKLRLNPQIPRKRKENGEPKDDWATATFQRDFNPYDNMWLI